MVFWFIPYGINIRVSFKFNFLESIKFQSTFTDKGWLKFQNLASLFVNLHYMSNRLVNIDSSISLVKVPVVLSIKYAIYFDRQSMSHHTKYKCQTISRISLCFATYGCCHSCFYFYLKALWLIYNITIFYFFFVEFCYK